MLKLFSIAYIGQPAMKKMGAKYGYSVVHGISYLPLCFFGISGLIMSLIAVVAINPLIVGSKYFSNEKNSTLIS